MPTKSRWPLALAEITGQSLIKLLEPSCERIELAGSIRRGRPDLGDIELLCVPKVRVVKDMFGNPVSAESELEHRCMKLIAEGFLDYRPNVRGAITFGLWNQLMVHQGTGIPVEIFTATAEDWGMAMVVRTGPKDFNVRMMTRFRELGMEGHAYGGVTRRGDVLHCATEARVFELLGWEHLDPGDRH